MYVSNQKDQKDILIEVPHQFTSLGVAYLTSPMKQEAAIQKKRLPNERKNKTCFMRYIRMAKLVLASEDRSSPKRIVVTVEIRMVIKLQLNEMVSSIM